MSEEGAPSGRPARRGRALEVWIGIAIGVLLHIPAVLYVLRAPILMTADGLGWSLLPTAVAVALSLTLLFFRRTRRVGAGVMLAASAIWLVFLGPCIGLLFMFSTFG
ncbi:MULTISPECIES: hypothetical protein [unclassified Microbacterium]|uniref:hypothetical protein n=1 Tax=unclassified Microbacterium TaxID=2609290 RepID=UPI0012F8D2DE|nr:hypothetical protein [Microbacterium sp. MAH-37]MVQ40674.1 hypothetical protein [Microbacterium sp. MAH-37]